MTIAVIRSSPARRPASQLPPRLTALMFSLAILSFLGYWIGRQYFTTEAVAAVEEIPATPAEEIEEVAREMRRQLAAHHGALARFRERLAELRDLRSPEEWESFCREAEGMLPPADSLAAEMAKAYERIRGQASRLNSFEPVLVDAQTGLPNRHAFDRTLGTMLEMQQRFGAPFAVVLFDIDHLAAHNRADGMAAGDAIVASVARLIQGAVRRTDFVARFAGEEFVMLLPHADLTAAAALTRRICGKAAEQLSISLSAGVAVGEPNDSRRQVLARVDAALYSAKTSQHDVYCHAGHSLRPHADLTGAAERASTTT